LQIARKLCPPWERHQPSAKLNLALFFKQLMPKSLNQTPRTVKDGPVDSAKFGANLNKTRAGPHVKR
jgi:hypothetical protein